MRKKKSAILEAVHDTAIVSDILSRAPRLLYLKLQ
jgi:hypothetical protein